MNRVLVIAVLAASVAVTPSAQQREAAPQRAIKGYETGATAILVDVVVRDKKGLPITDLSEHDFEIYEGDVRQEIGSFTPVIGAAGGVPGTAVSASPTVASASSRPSSGTAPSPAEDRTPIVALVFDRLSPEGRALAHKAAQKYLGREAQASSYIGVYGIDLSLLTYQPYTRDTTKLRQALDRAANRSTSQHGSSEESGSAARRTANAQESLSAAMSGGGQAMGGASSEAQFAEIQQRMTEGYEMLEKDQQGYATTNGLLAVVNSLRVLPGRKSLILLSEGLSIPPDVLEQFRSVIDSANRANVSIYTMDAAGLRAESKQAETRDIVNAAGAAALRRNPTLDPSDAMMKVLERNEDTLRLDPHSGLGQLADQTGGVLIRETNDLAVGLRRIEEDMRNYYLLTYVPKDDRLDGSFRTISVKVKRPGVEVAARKGYYAVRPSGSPVLTYEAAALALLETTPVPNAFHVRAMAARFPEHHRPGLIPVLVALPLAAVQLTPDTDGKTYRGDVTVLVRFKNQANEVVKKMSQHYRLRGPLEQIDRAKKGQILFYREPELTPGLYTMETVAYDAVSDKASVRFVTVEHPQVDVSSTRVSTLVLVERGERLMEKDRPAANPFLVGDFLLYPNLGEPLRKSTEKELAFFFTVYPGAQATPKAELELMRDGRVVAQTALPLGSPDSTGRIQQVSRFPLADLHPGTYNLRVIVADGKAAHARSVMVRVAE